MLLYSSFTRVCVLGNIIDSKQRVITMSHLFKKLVASARQLNSKLDTIEDQRAQERNELVCRWQRATSAIIKHRNMPSQDYPEKRVGGPLRLGMFSRLEQLQPIAYDPYGSSLDNAGRAYLFITKSGRLVYQTPRGDYRYLTDVYAITDEDVENMERAFELE